MEAKLANPRMPAGIFLVRRLLNSLVLLLRFLPKTLASLCSLSSWVVAPQSSSPPAAPVVSVSSSALAMDLSELRRVFAMFDHNGDGRITRRELSDSLGSLGMFISEKELEGMIKKIDVDGDGCVDVGEFRELYRELMEEREGAAAEEEDMREAFGVFDANNDGYITVEELRTVLASLGLKQGRTVEECERMIGKVDVDGDGVVDFQEFKQMMRGGGLASLRQ